MEAKLKNQADLIADFSQLIKTLELLKQWLETKQTFNPQPDQALALTTINETLIKVRGFA
jgi:succinate dehydrogenase/fumarate reductase-like Fe-S protein